MKLQPCPKPTQNLVTAAALWALGALWAALPAHGAMRVTDLRCEYASNPLGIDAARPRLSWVLASDKRGFLQGGYRIIVGTDAQLVDANVGDLWDSKMVRSDQSVQVPYEGRPLTSRQKCYWKVMVWDEHGQPAASSAIATWEMGLLEAGDWHAHWISRTTDTNALPAPLLRREFTLQGQLKQARVYLCGLGYYELNINGRKVGDQILDPGYTRYDKRDLYVTYDVTRLLKEGQNALGVLLGNGWYNVQTKAVWYFDKAPWRAAPKLLLQLCLDYEDGRTVEVVSDEQWKTSTGPILFNSIYGGETYDARLEKPGWTAPGYDDSAWDAVQIVDPPKGRLSAQMMPPIKVAQTLVPVKLAEPKPGVWLFDFGQNFAGFAQLTVTGSPGDQVVMKYGERINPDGTLDQTSLAQHLIKTNPPQAFQTDTYILKGGAKETWESRFVYHGFQYVEVTGFPGKPTLDNLRGRFIHSAVPEAGQFNCSNQLLNRIWRNARWSYLSNLQGIPTDCPHREKNGWTGDAHLAAEQAMYNYFPPAVYTKWIQDLADEQQSGGELPGIVPTSGWGYAWGNGPAWDSAFLLLPFYLYQYYGDRQILQDHYSGLRRYVDYLSSKADNGIVSLGLGDWCPFETETPVPVTSTAYYYKDALIVAQAAELLGNEADAQKYHALARAIKKAFNEKFFQPQSGSYANGSQTALSCALYQGLVEPENKAAVLKNLLANIERRQGHLDCGILGTKYLLNALLENGRADVACQIASQRTLPSWGHWIEQGATTLWESWRGTDSRNHIMFGDISAWFFKALAGINLDPAAPGFKRIMIKPYAVGGLTFVSAEYLSIHGKIASAWTKDGQTFQLNLTIPANTTATVHLPANGKDQVKEGGQEVEKADGVQFIRQEGGRTIFQVGSGTYHFTVSSTN